jgi:glyoxylase-like metal-dependent hydrolase (beta-lactamase superfamily II)
MSTTVRKLKDVLTAGDSLPESSWQLRVIQSEDCLSYFAWNEKAREALLVDPKREDMAAYRAIARDLGGYLFLGVIDTHTHADHISIAADIARELNAPLIMHAGSPTSRAQLRVSHSVDLPAHAAPVQLIQTPGHTRDSITVIWGPFLFGGDTVLFGDTGRDDLPGGDPEAHFESLEALKRKVKPETVVLPGHDHKGGRASSWATQLKVNAALTQSKEDFVRESMAFSAPAPKLLKESLRENFR